LEYLKRIRETKAIHKEGFTGVKQTISSREQIQDFDFYFDYVLKIADGINL